MRITKDQIAMYNRTETLKSLDELEMENENPENVLKCQTNPSSEITAMKTETKGQLISEANFKVFI